MKNGLAVGEGKLAGRGRTSTLLISERLRLCGVFRQAPVGVASTGWRRFPLSRGFVGDAREKIANGAVGKTLGSKLCPRVMPRGPQ